MSRSLRNIVFLSIVVISSLMHFKHFSKDLMSIHVWRQTQTQSNIINFYEEDMNILNPRRNNRGETDGILRMEFPLMQWMVAGLYKIFGNHLIISRLFMFVIGLLSVLGIYKLLFELFKNRILSITGAWAFNFSPCFYYYTINPLPDNLALCCSIWGIALFFNWYNNKKFIHLLLNGLLLSIGALCKLPFIIYFIVPFIYFVSSAFRKGINKKLVIRSFGIFGFLLLPFSWYITVIPQWNNPVVKGMLDNNTSKSMILDYLQHNLISTLPELLLNYGALPFFLAGFYFLFKKRAFRDSRFLMILGWSLVVSAFFFFEVNAIAKVHDYYLFSFYPLLFILVAYGAYNILTSKSRFLRYAACFLLILLPFTCYLRMQVRWNPDTPGFNKDLLVYKSELREAVPKESLVVAGNDESRYIFFYYIDKKGWAFNNNLTAQKLREMIDKGAEYLYTDAEKVYNHEEIKQYLGKLITKKGSIRVYKLINQ